jgi:DNA (cytosine-5)-methyltransferase 1
MLSSTGMTTLQRSLWVPPVPRLEPIGIVAEFFAGIGLVRLGLERAGWRVAWANDIDPVKQRQYDAHFTDAADHYLLADVHTVDPTTLPRVDLATASFPCTDLSVAGGRRGIRQGESSSFWGFIDVLGGMPQRPRLVLLENVVGFLTSNKGLDFRDALQSLNELGYAVDAFVLDAKWFVPQSRARMFVVGVLGEKCTSIVPPASRTRPQRLIDARRQTAAVRWTVLDIPEPPHASDARLDDIIEILPEDSPLWWSAERTKYLYDQMSDRHRTLIRTMKKGSEWNYGTVFRRVRPQPDGTKRSMGELRTDGIAGCLRTPKGGSGRQIIVRAGHGTLRARLMTPRECARLMGADDFILSGTLNEQLFGFGDAVCVSALEWIGHHVLSPLMSDSVRGRRT